MLSTDADKNYHSSQMKPYSLSVYINKSTLTTSNKQGKTKVFHETNFTSCQRKNNIVKLYL